nr:VWA-like domain-containing protein [Rhodopirellula islandica]
MASVNNTAASGGSDSKRDAKARERITRVVESWYLVDPLLFVAWTLHEVVPVPEIATLRVAHGRVEFNPAFISSLKRDELADVLRFEAMRILLGHPYARRQPKTELSYSASNLTVQECLRSKLPMPRPREVLGSETHDHQYFEYYYRQLAEREGDQANESEEDDPKPDDSEGALPGEGVEDADENPNENGSEPGEAGSDVAAEQETDSSEKSSDQEGSEEESLMESEEPSLDSPRSDEAPDSTAASDLESYVDPHQTGAENADQWDADDLLHEEIKSAVADAAENGGWGTLPGHAQERLLATLRPPLDYRSILRQFRQSVLSVDRRLTRMRPSRRYGFAQMGSRYDFTTRLLFAVDVSGSMGHRDLQNGFSIINRFFQYGIRSIDVIWFDTEVRCEPLTFRSARRDVSVTGRGGTHLSCVTQFIDEQRGYDGVVVFTDGDSPSPRLPRNRQTRILWLFNTQAAFRKSASDLKPLGSVAFLKPSRATPGF